MTSLLSTEAAAVTDPGPAAQSAAAIETHGLAKSFGRQDALNGFGMSVPTSSVYALLGRNGAGKSTLIQCLMGMLEPTAGSVQVLGLDPVGDSVRVKQRLGYMPDRLPMYDWMTVKEILKFASAFYEQWSLEDESALIARFRIKPEQKVGALSRGNRALLSLVIAMAHRPELLLMDECTSGMDAIARREFDRSVIDSLQERGRTILFAGHQIDEMERICDWVGIMHGGRMLVEMPLEQLKSTVYMVRVAGDFDFAKSCPGVAQLSRRIMGRETFVTVRDPLVLSAALTQQPDILETIPLSLEEIFTALVEAEETV